MADTSLTEYDTGFEAGLVQGYRAVRAGNAGARMFDEQLRRRRVFLAWGTLVLGLGSVAGAIVARRDKDMFLALTVAGGVVTTLLGAAQILVDESASGPFGLK